MCSCCAVGWSWGGRDLRTGGGGGVMYWSWTEKLEPTSCIDAAMEPRDAAGLHAGP